MSAPSTPVSAYQNKVFSALYNYQAASPGYCGKVITTDFDVREREVTFRNIITTIFGGFDKAELAKKIIAFYRDGNNDAFLIDKARNSNGSLRQVRSHLVILSEHISRDDQTLALTVAIEKIDRILAANADSSPISRPSSPALGSDAGSGIELQRRQVSSGRRRREARPRRERRPVQQDFVIPRPVLPISSPNSSPSVSPRSSHSLQGPAILDEVDDVVPVAAPRPQITFNLVPAQRRQEAVNMERILGTDFTESYGDDSLILLSRSHAAQLEELSDAQRDLVETQRALEQNEASLAQLDEDIINYYNRAAPNSAPRANPTVLRRRRPALQEAVSEGRNAVRQKNSKCMELKRSLRIMCDLRKNRTKRDNQQILPLLERHLPSVVAQYDEDTIQKIRDGLIIIPELLVSMLGAKDRGEQMSIPADSPQEIRRLAEHFWPIGIADEISGARRIADEIEVARIPDNLFRVRARS